MKLHLLQDKPSAEMAQALTAFEGQFTYPLGKGRSFHISHGEDYPRFFRAMGEATSIVAMKEARVIGSLGLAVRPMLLPEGQEITVAYLGDLRVAPSHRRELVFLRMAWAAQSWLRDKASAGFGVVMDGTAVTPDAYTGGLGIPAARVLGQVVIWQFPCKEEDTQNAGQHFLAEKEPVLECYRRLSRGRYGSWGGTPEVRSEMPPIWLLHPKGLACGLVEDTRRAKRLLADDGRELRSAHLSFFAYQSARAGYELLEAALGQAFRHGHPALFVAVAQADIPTWEEILNDRGKIVAPATIYGNSLDESPAWNINSSEI